MKTEELSGAALDWAVSMVVENSRRFPIWLDGKPMSYAAYSTDWAHGGPIIEREKLGVWWAHHIIDGEGNEHGNHWYSETGLTDENADERHYCMEGATPLIAAMRCYVASKLGDEVEVPEELTTGGTL